MGDNNKKVIDWNGHLMQLNDKLQKYLTTREIAFMIRNTMTIAWRYEGGGQTTTIHHIYTHIHLPSTMYTHTYIYLPMHSIRSQTKNKEAIHLCTSRYYDTTL